MSSKAKIILSVSVLAIVAIVIYIFSVTCPWTGDDIYYKFNWAAKPDLEGIDSISDIFVSQYAHYFKTNGRFVAHCFVQFFCALAGKQAFAICNGLMYIAFILLALKLSSGDYRKPLAVLSASLLTLIAFNTYYVPCCQIGYAWMFVLVFLWLHFFFNTNTKSIFKLTLFFLFSIIAGNSHEAITLGISGALIIYAITNFKKLTPSQWTAFFGFGIGALSVCLSPAAISRAEGTTMPLLGSFFYMFISFRTFYILILILSIKLITRNLNIKEFYLKNTLYLNAIFILLIFNLIIKVETTRQLLGIEALSIILILRLLNETHFGKKALFLLTMFTTITYFIKWDIITQTKNHYLKINTLYTQSLNGDIYYDHDRLDYYFSRSYFVWPVAVIDPGATYQLNSLENLYRFETGDTTKVLKIYPECLQNINDSTHVENQVVEFDEGCFVVVQSKENPADFTLKRTLDIFFYKRPHSDYKFSWDNPQFEGPNYKANIIYQAVPFVTNDSIIIE